MKFEGFIGPTYLLNSVNVDCQRCVNLIPEIIQSGTGKEGSRVYYKSAEGLELVAEVGEGPIRLVHQDLSGQIIVVSGIEVYRIITTTLGVESIDIVKIGDIGDNEPDPAPQVDTTLQVKAVSGETGGEYWTIIVDGSWQNYYYNHDITYGTEDFGTFASFGYPPVLYSQFVDYLDGYIVHLVPAENRFYLSDINNVLTVDALSFATAEGNPDRSISMLVCDRLLWIFNERSIEIYANVGNVDFPLERISGGFIEIGCLAPYSVAKIATTPVWLGRNENGQGTIYAGRGERISTHAVEQAISSYANPERAVAYTYSRDGHSFYTINFAEGSWCYDFSTGMWHERAFKNEDGDYERHRANTLNFRGTINYLVESDYFNKYFVGDYETNKVYLLKQGHFWDDESPFGRMRIAPHISAGKKNVFHHSFELDMQVGVGLDGGGLGSDPQIMMTYSNDGGHTYSNEAWASLGQTVGAIGEYRKRVKWNRLGSARDRVYKVEVTDPVDVVMIDADLEIEVGSS